MSSISIKDFPALSHLAADVGKVRSEKFNVGVFSSMRQVFEENEAKIRFTAFRDRLAKDPRINLVTLDGIAPDGIIYAGQLAQTDVAIQKLLSSDIGALIFKTGNYSDEESAAKTFARIYKALNVPVITYAQPDVPIKLDRSRALDDLCGMLAARQYMRVMMRKEPGFLPYKQLDSPEFGQALDTLIRMSSGIRTMRNVRMVQIGADQPTFYAIQEDPHKLARLFGLRVETVETLDLVEYVEKTLATIAEATSKAPEWLFDLVSELEQIYEFSAVRDEFPDLPTKMALIIGWILELLKEKQSNCISIRCWPELMRRLGVMVCSINALLYALGILAPCETDKPGIVTSALLNGMGLGDDADRDYFLDLTRFGDGLNKDLILWWHCGQCSPFGARCNCGNNAWTKVPLKAGWIFHDFRCAGLIDVPTGTPGDEMTYIQMRSNAAGELVLSGMNGVIADTSDDPDAPSTIGAHHYSKVLNPEVAYEHIMLNGAHHHSVRKGNYLPILHTGAQWLGLDTKPVLLDNIG